MKKIILFYFLSFLLYNCQNSKTKPIHNLKFGFQTDSLLRDTSSVSVPVDSLKREILNAPSDTLAINYLNELSAYWRKPANILANEALEQSKKINYSYGETEAVSKMGSYYRKFSKYKIADSLFEIALQSSLNKNQEPLHTKILILLGDLRVSEARYAEALKYLMEALPAAKKIKQKNIEASCLYTLGEAYRMQYANDTARIYFYEAIKIAEKINDKIRLASCLSSIGDMYSIEFDLDSALIFLKQSLAISKVTKDKSRVVFSAAAIGKVYISKGDFKNGLEHLNLANNVAEEIGDKFKMAEISKSLAYLYRTQENPKKAIELMNRSINIFEELGNKRNLANAIHMLGEIYSDINDTAKAMECFVKARDQSIAINNQKELSNVFSSIGEMYYQKKKYQEALDYFTNALKLSRETADIANESYCLKCLTDVYLVQGNLRKARECAEKAAIVSKESEVIYEMMDAQKGLYHVYDTLNLPAKALKAFVEYTKLKDSTTNENQIRKFASAEYAGKEERLKAEQSAKEKVFKAEQLIKEEEIKRQKTTRNFFIGGFILLAAFAFVIYRSLQQNKRDKTIIQEQKILVEEKQKEMTDSITYAKRLQEAILPSLAIIKQHLPNCFIFYKPKDIVAGDFYWYYYSKNNKTGKEEILMAVADCTGHGVPGAMVSVVCSNALDRAVKEFGITEPGKILDKVRELVIETFEKSDKDVKDGMDISLVNIQKTKEQNTTVQWAGANNPLWYVSDGQMDRVASDKQPIGKYDKETPFVTQTLKLAKGTILYLFTDGYADQFGGEDGKKLKYKPLADYITTISDKSMDEQKKFLAQKFSDWKGNLEQVDDVCIVGIKV